MFVSLLLVPIWIIGFEKWFHQTGLKLIVKKTRFLELPMVSAQLKNDLEQKSKKLKVKTQKIKQSIKGKEKRLNYDLAGMEIG